MYALFKDGQMISKPFSTQDECAVVAAAKGMTVQMPRVVETILAPGVSIHELHPVGKP